MKCRGLYGFQCLVTESLYIGSSQNLWGRFYQHSLGHKSNIILQHAIKKYGLINFIFIVFESVDANSNLLDKNELERLESELIAGFDKKVLYNINNNTATRKGISHTAEAKLKMKKLRAQRGHSLERVVYVYDKALNFVAKFGSLWAVKRKLGIDRSILAKCIKSGKVWRNIYIFKDVQIEQNKAVPLVIPKKYKGNNKDLYVYDNAGSLAHVFTSYTEAANQLGVPLANIGSYIKSEKIWKKKYYFTNENKGLNWLPSDPKGYGGVEILFSFIVKPVKN